jgi:hypothetical protein
MFVLNKKVHFRGLKYWQPCAKYTWKIKKCDFCDFSQISKDLFFRRILRNLKMQDVSSIFLLQKCAIKTDSYWGLTFLEFFEKCAVIIFYLSHFASYISQIHYVSRSKHKFDVILHISVRKNLLALKELENWVGNSKISCKVLYPWFFFICEYRYHSLFHFWCVICFKTWILVGFYLKFQ